MTDAPQPTSGSLEATIIRACTVHRMCPLTCTQRRVEELGSIASFDTRQESSPSSRSWIVEQFNRFFGKDSP
jgi:hypothetical protein